MATATLLDIDEYLNTSYRPDREYIDGERSEDPQRTHVLWYGLGAGGAAGGCGYANLCGPQRAFCEIADPGGEAVDDLRLARSNRAVKRRDLDPILLQGQMRYRLEPGRSCGSAARQSFL